MKNKILKSVIVGAIYLLAFFCCFLIVYGEYRNYLTVILGVLGIIADVIFFILFHEGGHILFAKKKGFDVLGFSVLFLSYDKTAKKKLKINFKNDYLGETDIIPTEKCKDLLVDYSLSMFFGVLGGIFATVILGVLYLVFHSFYIPKLLLTGLPITVAFLVINAIPYLNPTSDMAKIKEIGKNESTLIGYEKYLEILKNLYLGKSFSEMDGELFKVDGQNGKGVERLITLFLLIREEELENYDKASPYAEILAKNDDLSMDEKFELLYFYSKNGEKEKADKLYKDLYLPFVSSANGVRSLVAYSKISGDEKYYSVAKPTAYKLAESEYVKGVKKYKKILVNKL